jgi:hypothetical protein
MKRFTIGVLFLSLFASSLTYLIAPNTQEKERP